MISYERIAVYGKIVVYCEINETILGPCSGGIWTLVMKIDGSKVPPSLPPPPHPPPPIPFTKSYSFSVHEQTLISGLSPFYVPRASRVLFVRAGLF